MTCNKKPAILFLAVFVVVLLSSITFTAIEASHDCTGDDCPVCFQLNICSGSLKHLALTVMALAVSLLASNDVSLHSQAMMYHFSYALMMSGICGQT